MSDAATNEEPKEVIARKVSGVVRWFHVVSGYGFINRDDTKEDVFVHQNSIIKYPPPNIAEATFGRGEHVEFDVVAGENGCQVAANVTGPGGAPVKGTPYYNKIIRSERR